MHIQRNRWLIGVVSLGALKNEVQHLWPNGAGGGGIWAKGIIS